MDSPLSVIRGTNDKPVSSEQLAKFFANRATANSGSLFIGYPIIGTAEGRHKVDALLISPDIGIVIFDLVEGSNPTDYDFRQDDSANKLEARLRTHRELLDRRSLLVPLHAISFAPGVADPSAYKNDDYPLANLETLTAELGKFTWADRRDEVYQSALSAIQSISTIRKARTRRVILREDSRGAKLKRLEDSIATLDNLQSKAVVETVDGVQRIRGLAGSGKTIVLALKAAYLHAQHPDWRIAVTFNTRSLKAQFRRLINNFSVEQTGEEPDWENLRILNAWGAPGSSDRDGIYHEFCRAHELDYLDFRTARDKFGINNAFAGACESAIGQAKSTKRLYDAVLVDEAQDFPPVFLRLCYELMGDPRRLVYRACRRLGQQSAGETPSAANQKELRPSRMPTPEGTKQQIDRIVSYLVEVGLASDQNFGFRRDVGRGLVEIAFPQSKHALVALKDFAYEEIYEQLALNRSYNVRLPDGALMQMTYLFKDNTIRQHRLAFFPAPHLEDFQSNPEIYLGDEMYAEVIAKNVVPFPMRFDYDATEGVPKELIHPHSHLTLGQYENCRIPVTAPVTPFWFTDFILRNFYHTAYLRYADDLPPFKNVFFEESILQAERRVLHIGIPAAIR